MLHARSGRYCTGFLSEIGSCVIGPLGRMGAAATLGQHCPQMTQRPGTLIHVNCCEHHRAHYRLSGFSFQLCNCNIVLDCNERKIL